MQALLSIDQEGGRVTRIRNGATVFPCANAIRNTGDPENAYLAGRIMGNELRALGIYFNLAPVLDTNNDADNPAVGSRSFGVTAQDTALYGGAYARGLRDAGIMDCGKHFPGHGDSVIDTHFAASVVQTPAEIVMEKYIKPFKNVIDQGLMGLMATHICYPSLEPSGVPASLSPRLMTDILRRQLRYEGITISDGMQMLAIAGVYGAPRGQRHGRAGWV